MQVVHSTRSTAGLAALLIAISLVAPNAALAAELAPKSAATDGAAALAHDSWIVTLAEGVDAGREAAGLARAAGGHVGLVYEHAFQGFQLKGSAAAADALARNPLVQSVEPDRPVSLAETLPFGVQRLDAFTLSGSNAYGAGYRGHGARIAIVDTGIDLDHPDLAAGIDQASGLNCLNSALPPNDGHGHGTHVAGSAAAPLNDVGVVGVAPEATLVAIKSFDDAGGSSEAFVVCGIDRLVALNTDATTANDIDVANLSWGEARAWGGCAAEALHRAICAASAAGVILVGGAGNSTVDAGTFVPAAFPEVISVSAMADFDGEPGGRAGCAWVPTLFWIECDDTFAFFSNYGSSVDLIAPGVNVYSTWAAAGYKVENGTSMATPHVTGIVALMAAADPGLTAGEALETLRRTGECPNGAWADADGVAGCAGQGTWPDDPDGIPEVLPNALRAAQAVGSPPPPPPPNPTPPTAPSLTATPGASSISLSWTTPADGGSQITGYQIWKGTASGGESLLTTLGVQNAWTDGAVVAGTTYWYQVAAVNAVAPGPRSNEQSARLIVRPSAPTLLGAAADRAAALSWTAPTDDGGGQISAYRLYRRVGGGPEALLATTGGSETSYADLNLVNGTAYSYRVAAVNVAGEGTSSNTVSVTPRPSTTITAPSPPQSLTATKPKGSPGILLSWAAPASDGGSPITSYFVYRRGPGETTFTLIDLTATRTYTDTGVSPRTQYTYVVTAFNTYYESGYSNQVTIRTR